MTHSFECSDTPYPTERDIDAILDEFRGDAREAIRALLTDIATLAADYETDVSFGYVRGAVPSLPVKRRT
jgi:hypothetical protein